MPSHPLPPLSMPGADQRPGSVSPPREYPTYAASVSSSEAHHVRSPSESRSPAYGTPPLSGLSSFGASTGTDTFGTSTGSSLFRTTSASGLTNTPTTGTPKGKRSSVFSRFSPARPSPKRRRSDSSGARVPLPPAPKPILLNRTASENDGRWVTASDTAFLETGAPLPPPHELEAPSPRAESPESPAALHITARGPVTSSYVPVQIPSPSFTGPMGFTPAVSPSASPTPSWRRRPSSGRRSPWLDTRGNVFSIIYPDGLQPPSSPAPRPSGARRSRPLPVPPVPKIPPEHAAAKHTLPAPQPKRPRVTVAGWDDPTSPAERAPPDVGLLQPVAGPSRLRTDLDHPLAGRGSAGPSTGPSSGSTGPPTAFTSPFPPTAFTSPFASPPLSATPASGQMSHQPSISSFASTGLSVGRLGTGTSTSSTTLVGGQAGNSETYNNSRDAEGQAESEVLEDEKDKGGLPWWARPRKAAAALSPLGKRPSPLVEEAAQLGDSQPGPGGGEPSPQTKAVDDQDVPLTFLPRTTYQLQRNGSRFTEHESTPGHGTPASALVQDLPVEPSNGSSSAASYAPPPVGRWLFWTTFAALALCNWVVALELTSVPVALPTIAEALKASVTEYCWIGSIYSLAAAAVVPWSGPLAFILGRPASLSLALLFFGAGSGLAGGAHSVLLLLIGRALQGFGAGFLGSLSLLVLGQILPEEDHAAHFGVLGIVWAAALGVGPVVGGALATLSWRWVFWIHLPPVGVSLILIAGLAISMPSARPPLGRGLRRVDWVGNILVTGAAASLILGLTTGGITHPWSSWRVIVPIVFAAAAFVAYLYFEAIVAPDPNLPNAILRNLTSISGLFATLLSASMFIIVQYWLPVNLQAVYGVGPLRTGLMLLLLSLGQAPWYMVAGIAVRVLRDFKKPLLAGWVVLTAGVGVLLLLHPSSGVGLRLGPLAIIAMGSGTVWATCAFPCQVPLPAEIQGHAMALYSSSRFLGQALGIAAGGTVLQNMLLRRLPDASATNGVLASIPSILSLPEPLCDQVQGAFSTSLQRVWLVGVGAGGVGLFVIIFLIRSIPLVSEEDAQLSPIEKSTPSLDLSHLEDEKSPTSAGGFSSFSDSPIQVPTRSGRRGPRTLLRPMAPLLPPIASASSLGRSGPPTRSHSPSSEPQG